MGRRTAAVVGIALAFGLALSLAGPMALRSCALWWAKRSALRIINDFSPEVREHMNSVPKVVHLVPTLGDERRMGREQIGSFIVEFPPADSRERVKSSLQLKYARFKVNVRNPVALATEDALARMLQYPDYFAMTSAAYNLRLNEIDAAGDLDTLHRRVHLLILKMDLSGGALETNFEQYDCGDTRGFVVPSRPNANGRLIYVFVYPNGVNCAFPLWFFGQQPMDLRDVHSFIEAVRFRPTNSAAATRTTGAVSTETSQAPSISN
jgi:hypothetical protein